MTNRLGYAREEGRAGERWCFVCQKLRLGETGMVTAKCPLEKGWLWNFDSKGQESYYSVFECHLVCFELTLLLI